MLVFQMSFVVPTPVRNLEVYPMNERSANENGVVIVRWDRPRAYNGRLIGYTVETCAVNPDGSMEQRRSCPVRLVQRVCVVILG